MARLLCSRLVLEGNIELVSALSLGGTENSIAVDHLIARDGAGRPYIPGTSLAGVVRHELEQRGFGADNEIWGKADAEHAASLIRFDDIALPIEVPTELRESTSIDSVTGAAKFGLKFNRQVIAAGAKGTLCISIDIPESPEAIEPRAIQTLSEITTLLKSSELSLGGRTSRGLGRIKLDDDVKNLAKFDLASREGIIAFVFGRNADLLPIRDTPVDVSLDHSQMLETVELEIIPKGPIMVASGSSSDAVDHLPMVAWNNEEWRQIVPGTSLGGVLRSIATRILRSLDQTTELAELLFGAANGSGFAGRSAVEVPDVLATRAAKPERWFRSGKEDPAYSQIVSENEDVAAHVAIDRWTGSVADGRLYFSLEPWDLELAPAVLRLNTKRLARAAQIMAVQTNRSGGADVLEKAALALYLLTLSEFRDRNPGIGYGTTRGYGTVEVKCDLPLPCASMKAAWTEYLDAQNAV